MGVTLRVVRGGSTIVAIVEQKSYPSPTYLQILEPFPEEICSALRVRLGALQSQGEQFTRTPNPVPGSRRPQQKSFASLTCFSLGISRMWA